MSDNEENNNEEEKTNDWKTFGFSCLFGVILSFISWIIGSNFIFFATMPDNILSKIFPDDPTKQPYAPKSKEEFKLKKKKKCSIKRPDDDFNPWKIENPIKDDGKSNVSSQALGAVNELGKTGMMGTSATIANKALTSGSGSALLNNATGELGANIPASANALGTNISGKTTKLPITTSMVGGDEKKKSLFGKAEETANKITENLTKSLNDPDFKWPYTMMYPFSDCNDPDDKTITDFYYEDNGNKGQIFDKEGNLVKDIPATIKTYEDYKKFIEEQLEKIVKNIKDQKKIIKNAQKKGTGDIEAMNEKLQQYKKAQKFYNAGPGFFNNIKNWMGSSIQYAMIKERSILNWIFKKLRVFFDGQNANDSDDLSLKKPNYFLFGFFGIIINIILAWFILHIIMMVGMILGGIGELFGKKYEFDGSVSSNWKKGLLYTLIMGFCFGISMWIPVGIGVFQYLEIIYKFIAYPILNHRDEWINNCKSTFIYLPYFYGFLVICAAFANLEPIYGNVMTLTYIVKLIHSNLKKNKEIKEASKKI